MKRGNTGDHVVISTVGSERVTAFVPAPLPPDPPLQIDERLQEKLDRALLELGRLDSVSTLLPDTTLFLYTYVRKEAVLSSQIEGTQSSLSDLLLFELEEAPGVPLDDVREVSSYVAALEYGLERLADGFPLSSRLLREIHGVLLAECRGADKLPGEFRASQNWIGGSRPGTATFVPPPPEHIADCITAFERFLHDDPAKNPVLVKAALAHAQFETIHPFLDGNGRVGRLFTALLFSEEQVLEKPLLYLSLYFKRHRQTYYDLLQRVRTDGTWEEWLDFFVTGIHETAESAVSSARRISSLFRQNRDRIQGLGRSAGSASRVLDQLERRPLTSIKRIADGGGLSIPAATTAVAALEELGIARELTGKKRNRLYAYSSYLTILNEGIEDSTSS